MNFHQYPEHLGDGAYASFDGYQVWLHAERDGREHCVALDEYAFRALLDYRQRLAAKIKAANNV